MSHMTVLDLLQCLFWAFGGILPLLVAGYAAVIEEDSKKQGGSGFLIMVIAMALQGAVMVCVYKAGRHS